MRNLLKSDFKRLFRNKFYYISLVLTIVGTIVSLFMSKDDPDYTCIDAGITDMAMFLEIFMAVLIPLFVCTEFSSGMIRNKISSGYSRVSIYISGVITTIAAAVSIVAAWAVAYFPVAISFWGPSLPDDGVIFDRVHTWTTLFLLYVTYAIFCHLICSIINKKATIIVILVLSNLLYGIFVQLFVMLYAYARPTRMTATEQEQIGGRIIVVYEEEENPFYLPENHPTRILAEAVDVVVFPSQYVTMSMYNIDINTRFLIFDALLSVVMVYGGTAIFKKKDLK